ncbi:MAG: hypothetical protein QOG34_1312 [Frankiaceae bacterium]|nr:hypothetical protein [Frankiaceae bacterium]
MTATSSGLDRALALAARALRLTALALHPAGAVVPAQRDSEGYLLAVPIRVGDAVHVLTAEAAQPFEPALAEMLVELARLFAGLADSAPASQAVLDLEADRAQIAAELDAVADALITAKHAVVEPAEIAAVDHALTLLRREQRQLRAHTLDAGLAPALQHAGMVVVGDVARLAGLPPAVAVVVERVAEALARGAVGDADEPAQISVEVTELEVKFRLESADKIRDASELDRWGRRISALGGELAVQARGVDVKLPARRDEGRR